MVEGKAECIELQQLFSQHSSVYGIAAANSTWNSPLAPLNCRNWPKFFMLVNCNSRCNIIHLILQPIGLKVAFLTQLWHISLIYTVRFIGTFHSCAFFENMFLNIITQDSSNSLQD